jgi:VWFA-related protein
MRTLLLLACAAGAWAQQKPEQPEHIIREQFRFVLVPVTVLDRDGQAVSGLQATEFRLFDNGKLQKITEDVLFHPISVVLAVQRTANMEKILPQVQKVGSMFDTLVMGETGEIAVVGFDHRIELLQDFTSEPGKVGEALKKLTPRGWNNRLNDAANEGINMLRRRPENRRRILVLVGETRDKYSEARLRDILTATEFANIVVYSINVSSLVTNLTGPSLPPRPDPIPPGARHMPDGSVSTASTQAQTYMGNWVPAFKELFSLAKGVFVDNPMEAFTKYTGGREYSFKSQKALENAISDLGSELHSQYMLLYSPNNKEEAGWHEIRVDVMRPGLKVRTRDGYWLAGIPQ